MSNTEIPGSPGSDGTSVCSRDAILAACVEPQRRKLLFALAAGGEQTGADLLNYGKQRVRRDHNRLDSALRHLAMMLESGVIVKKTNPQDGRRPLYALPPWTKVSVTPSATEIDFRTCVLRLKPDRD